MKLEAKQRLKAAPMFINVPIMPRPGDGKDDEKKRLEEAVERMRHVLKIDPLLDNETAIRNRIVEMAEQFNVNPEALEKALK